MFLLKSLLRQLLFEEPFIANIIMQLSRCEDINFDSPAAIATNDSTSQNFTLIVNPTLMQDYDLSEQMCILMHEVLHIVNDHHLRSLNKNLSLWNLSCDFAVNSLIKHRMSPKLKEQLFLPEHYGLPESKSADWYYTKLQVSGFDIPEINHSYWKASASAKPLVQQASQITSPSIDLFLEKSDSTSNSKLDWKQLLSSLVKQHLSYTKRSTQKRLSRRFGRPPGKQRDISTPTIAVVLDTSESIVPDFLKLFLKEIDIIAKRSEADIVVLECDEEVRRIYKYDAAEKIEQVSGRGSTAYRPAFEKIHSLSNLYTFGCIIYFTDGYSNDTDNVKRPSIPTIWVYPQESCPKAVKWGSHVYV